MNNQDMSANPHPSIERSNGEREPASTGETKREKAFWQVYTSMLSYNQNSFNLNDTFDDIASIAIAAVNAGFKALESDNEVG